MLDAITHGTSPLQILSSVELVYNRSYPQWNQHLGDPIPCGTIVYARSRDPHQNAADVQTTAYG